MKTLENPLGLIVLLSLLAGGCSSQDKEALAQDGGSPDMKATTEQGAAADTALADIGESRGGPIFLSFGTNTSELSEGQSVIFTAVLTDPDGIDDLIGGTLTSPDESISYGAFSTSGQEGSYSLTQSWEQLNQAAPISFLASTTREFKVKFFDVIGHTATKTTSVRLFCVTGTGACSGKCVDTRTDARNCGACGTKCDGCVSGVCYALTDCDTNTSADSCADVCAAKGKACGFHCNGAWNAAAVGRR